MYNCSMKKRDYKNFSEKSIYHLYNRGNNKQTVFYDEQDYRAFLFRIGLALGIDTEVLNNNEFLRMPKSRVRITKSPPGLYGLHGFCLMPNHFHLLIEQFENRSISKFMSKICTSFSMYMNKKYNRVGHVFQDRFKSVPIENNSQLMWTSAYIHMNPVKGSLVTVPHEYKWSSFNDLAGNRKLPITHTDFINYIFETKENFIKQTLAVDMSRTVLDNELV